MMLELWKNFLLMLSSGGLERSALTVLQVLAEDLDLLFTLMELVQVWTFVRHSCKVHGLVTGDMMRKAYIIRST